MIARGSHECETAEFSPTTGRNLDRSFVMTDPVFIFRPLAAADLKLLRSWLDAPHVRRWWRADRTDPVFQGIDTGAALPPGHDAFIAELDGHPVGFIAGYWASRHPSGAWDGVENVTDATKAIDFLIGEPDMVNRKQGRVMIRAFVTELFKDPDVDRVVADPARDNWPANIALKRIGFRDRGRIDKPGVNAMLLTLARGVFKP
jgi:aminoglycoside 6'-N-acetyltransferase